MLCVGSQISNLDMPCNVQVEADVESEQLAAIQFYGGIYKSQGFYFLLDASGSTHFHALEIEKREVVQTIDGLPPRCEFAVVFFNATQLQIFPASERAILASADAKKAAKQFIASVKAQGDTCVGCGLVKILRMAQNSRLTHRRVIYVGDGGTNCFYANPERYAQKVLSDVRRINNPPIPVDTICVGYQVAFPTVLAQMTGGRHRRINSENEED